MDLGYSSGNSVDHRFGNGFNAPYDGGSRAGGYNQHGRFGLGVGGHANSGRVGGSMNGSIHGPKHKRGDIDRECELCYSRFHRNGINGFIVDNRFAGSRLEDLIPEVPGMCKDQHGCRFLQKKLEEGIPEHRDIIFRETFSHFADLMTGTKIFELALETFLSLLQIHLATTSARSCSSIPQTTSATSSANPWRAISSQFLSTCMALVPFRR